MSIFSKNLRFLREQKGLKLDDFLEIGIKRGTMSNYELGNTEPKLDIIREISKFFRVSIDDLLNIDLSIKTNAPSEKHNNPSLLENSTYALQANLPIPNKLDEFGIVIPVYNAEASAGGGALRLDREYIIGHVMVPFAKKGDIALTSVGNSMLPVITPGDILVVRQRFDWKEYLEPGKIYVIVTTEEVFVKVISSFSQKLTLHSYNPQYEDFTVPESYVHAIFKLIGTISAKSY